MRLVAAVRIVTTCALTLLVRTMPHRQRRLFVTIGTNHALRLPQQVRVYAGVRIVTIGAGFGHERHRMLGPRVFHLRFLLIVAVVAKRAISTFGDDDLSVLGLGMALLALPFRKWFVRVGV